MLSLILSAALGPARAEEPTLEEMVDMSLAELLEIKVTSATRTEQSVGEVPATVYLVAEDTLRARGYRTVAEVLHDLPEIQVAHRANEETQNWVTMRGISGNDKFLILRDGVRASAPTGRPEELLQSYSLFEVKRIEIILGPASSLYGADAFAGIINIITKSGADLQGGKITASYGMFDTTHNGVVWGDEFGDVQVALSAQIYHSDEPVLPDYYPEDYAAYLHYRETGELEGWGGPVQVENRPWKTPYNAWSMSAKINIRDFEIGYFRSSQQYVPSASSTVSQTTHSSELQNFQDYREILMGRHSYETGGRRPIRFETTLSRTANWLDNDSGYSNLFTGYARYWKAEWGHQYTAQEIVNFQLAEGYTLTAGLTYDNVAGMPKTTDLDRPYDPSLPTGSQPAVYSGTDLPIQFYVINDQNLGTSLQFQAQPVEAVQLILGSRYDYNRRFGSTVNPRAGVVLTPHERFTAKLLYGEAFLSPTMFASYQHYGSFDCESLNNCTGGFFHVPSPDLEPEKLRTMEVSTTHAWTEHLITSASAFYSRASNRIELGGEVTTGSFLGVDNVSLQPSVNRGTMYTYGGTVRLEAQIPVGPLSLRPDVAYTHIAGDIELDTIEDALPNAAPHSVKGGLELGLGRLTIAPRAIFLSDTLEGQGETVPASFVVNLAARYDNLLGTDRLPLSAFAHATNLLDSRYYHAPGADLGGGFTMARIPQDPLRIDAGLSLEF
jgi:outer membrane receptor protein involved in Fe transport